MKAPSATRAHGTVPFFLVLGAIAVLILAASAKLQSMKGVLGEDSRKKLAKGLAVSALVIFAGSLMIRAAAKAALGVLVGEYVAMGAALALFVTTGGWGVVQKLLGLPDILGSKFGGTGDASIGNVIPIGCPEGFTGCEGVPIGEPCECVPISKQLTDDFFSGYKAQGSYV